MLAGMKLRSSLLKTWSPQNESVPTEMSQLHRFRCRSVEESEDDEDEDEDDVQVIEVPAKVHSDNLYTFCSTNHLAVSEYVRQSSTCRWKEGFNCS